MGWESRIPNETHWYTIFWRGRASSRWRSQYQESSSSEKLCKYWTEASLCFEYYNKIADLQHWYSTDHESHNPLQYDGTWLCGARECAIISTIVKPLSASNDCPREDRPLLWMRLDFCLTLFKSGLAPEEASGPGGRQIVVSQCQQLRCLRILLLEWLTMMAALRNYSA